jgi:integrase
MGRAYAERIIDLNPLDGMSPPPQAAVRLHASIEDVRAILNHAQNQVDLVRRDRVISPQTHRAEQVLLLARLAADSGARRGELAALRLGDLDGDVLTISRGVSNEVLGPTKNRGIRRMTLGATAADLWGESVERWRSQAGPPFGPWLFSAVPDHGRRLSTSALGHWFAALALVAGHSDVTASTAAKVRIHAGAAGPADSPEAASCESPSSELAACTSALRISPIRPRVDADPMHVGAAAASAA